MSPRTHTHQAAPNCEEKFNLVCSHDSSLYKVQRTRLKNDSEFINDFFHFWTKEKIEEILGHLFHHLSLENRFNKEFSGTKLNELILIRKYCGQVLLSRGPCVL